MSLRERENSLPDSWQYQQLQEVAEVTRGEELSKFATPFGIYPFFTSSVKNPERINKYSYDADAILITITGNFLAFLCRGKFEASDHVFILKTKNRNLFYFLFEQLKIKLQILHKEDSGILKTLRLQRLLNLQIFIPNNKTLEKFNEICEFIQLKIENLQKNIERLEIMKKDLHKMIFNQKISVI
ncbi:restriction endonuclease subunit S [Mycoplasma suis]|uniref:Type I restriction-modification system specificity subunit n=1 Tax=Mycoplasma suis (strain Illinois) TaxID=768700 RepID=F0QS52_MYCSL|nr:restriction endonuclease subunit S [Mycoplasma suis]ADX98322.1 type I restriction-modification system specificity subunit [Mycoplasma suis str. Illinois]